MRTPIIAALAGALLALAGCQNAATSSYGGSIDRDGTRAQSTTVLKKVGKKRIVRANGDVVYVNQYKRVPRKSARKTVRSAYVAKPKRSKSTNAFAKVLKKKVVKRKTVAAKKRATKRSSKGASKSPKNLNALIAKHARANGVPLRLAKAVVKVESAGRVNARGAAGEIGLMQLMPRTARGMGYKGKLKKLYDPNKNLAYGMKYLGEAYRRGGKTTCGAILKYNAGHYAKRWNPTSRKYCKRVKKIMKKG